MPSLPASMPAAVVASPALLLQQLGGRAWGPVLGAFLAGWGAAWLLLKGVGPNTRRDALSRFKVCAHG